MIKQFCIGRLTLPITPHYVDTGTSVSLHPLGRCVRTGHQAKASSGMKLQLCRDSVLFPSPPPFRRRTPCNSPELSPFGSECLGEAGQKITRCLKIPILPHQIRQREEDRARCGGRRTSGQRRGVNPSHTAHPLDLGSATVSERHWYSVLSGHSHGRHDAGGGFGRGAGRDGRETSESEVDTAMHETGRAPRAKEVGESV